MGDPFPPIPENSLSRLAVSGALDLLRDSGLKEQGGRAIEEGS